MVKKRYALVGASSRGLFMYAIPLSTELSEYAEIVGIFDPNRKRAEFVREYAGLNCPVYTDFNRIISDVKPDCAIITTIDRTHHEYAVKCLDVGIDVITEKPMAIDADKCSAILEAEKRDNRRVVVTFNYRFTPYVTAIRQALKDKVIGDILSIDFEYLLDTSHGADYFRRWHRCKENSGGLLVHKATHHFDLINWWIEEEPVDVMAFGTRRFYGPTRSERGERCSECRYSDSCEYYWDINACEWVRRIYKDCEDIDGYHRDGCVFSPEIDIEDTMSVNVRYSKGALLSYSLIAHCPYEGWKVSINGTNGRIEAAEFLSGPRASEPDQYFYRYDRHGRKTTHTVSKASGDHGGGDKKLREMVFIGGIPDPLGHQADSFAGAVSILIGIAANKSIAENRMIKVNDLVSLDLYRQR